ncbi:MAG: rhomboid family intramembrane serine protease [Clostridia bacterium]|jgi:membrane associated rhomboid family serine protease|nr:rhomboid family intramembrane serine protease [Clostridia bacterium]
MLFVRRESFQQFISYYPVVTGIAAVNTLLFFISFIPSLYHLVYGFGVGSNILVGQGELWRLLTPVFLHGNFSHFLFNTFSLVILAPALERMLGIKKFLSFYLLAGIAGNVGTFLVAGANYTHLGASGAIYGLLGLYLYLSLYRQDLIDPQSAQLVKVMLVVGVIYSFIMPNINFYAHLFGFLAGLGGGWLVFTRGLNGRTNRFGRKDRNDRMDRIKDFFTKSTVLNPREKYRTKKIGDNIFAFDPHPKEKQPQHKAILPIAGFVALLVIYLVIKSLF